MPTPETQLVDLLVATFTNDELIRFLYEDEATRPFIASLPHVNTSPAQFMFDAVLLLRRRGYVDAGLFQRLATQLAPSERAKVAGVAKAFGISVPVEKSGPAPFPTVLRILLMAAGPRTGAELRVSVELRGIRQRLLEGKYRERFDLRDALAMQPSEILATLDRYPAGIVHFSGHGTRDGQLVFEGSRGEPFEVQPEAFARGIKVTDDGSNVRLLVLNACFSAKGAGVVVATGASPFAVGMQREISDRAAIAFSSELYRSLADGVPLQGAFDRACTQIALEGCRGEDDIPCLVAAPGFDARAARFT